MDHLVNQMLHNGHIFSGPIQNLNKLKFQWLKNRVKKNILEKSRAI